MRPLLIFSAHATAAHQAPGAGELPVLREHVALDGGAPRVTAPARAKVIRGSTAIKNNEMDS